MKYSHIMLYMIVSAIFLNAIPSTLGQEKDVVAPYYKVEIPGTIDILVDLLSNIYPNLTKSNIADHLAQLNVFALDLPIKHHKIYMYSKDRTDAYHSLPEWIFIAMPCDSEKPTILTNNIFCFNRFILKEGYNICRDISAQQFMELFTIMYINSRGTYVTSIGDIPFADNIKTDGEHIVCEISKKITAPRCLYLRNNILCVMYNYLCDYTIYETAIWIHNNVVVYWHMDPVIKNIDPGIFSKIK